jgi:undecaprenyl diphosphate synthase
VLQYSRPITTSSAPVPSPRVPAHVAIIMDGNGRWAQARGQIRTDGHTKGADAVREVVRACRREGVRYLTLYAFSVANWSRPAFEVRALMQLLAQFANSEKGELREQGIKLSVIGEFHRLSPVAQTALHEAIEFTQDGTSMVLSLALSYGGRHDITNAARSLAERVKNGSLNPSDITEDLLRKELTTRSLPDVDLLIRTGGESRVSDFLLYESAYAELAFMPVMWPDFTEQHLLEAFAAFASRERRFGLTSAQVRETNPTSANHPSSLERVLYRVD